MSRWRPGVARIALAVLLCGLLTPAGALADGDPASDTLLGQNVFYPYAPPTAASVQRMLNAETAAAKRARFPIKVALIAAASGHPVKGVPGVRGTSSGGGGSSTTPILIGLVVAVIVVTGALLVLRRRQVVKPAG